MSATQPEADTQRVVAHVPSPREPEPDRLQPWSPQVAVPGPRGVHWLEEPVPLGPDPAAEPTAPADSPARPHRVRALVGLGLALVTGLGVAGVVTGPPPTMTVPGTLTVAGVSLPFPGESCFPESSAGAVTIFSTDGTVIGSAPLTAVGVALDRWQTRTPAADACRVPFTVTGVPSDQAHYRVGLDGDFSDTVGFSHDDLATTGAQITVGH